METYYLNITGTKDAMDVAARENGASEKSVFELQDLIQKITLHDKSEESHEFAKRVQASLYTFDIKSFPGSKNRGVKTAPFVVLIGANMPSVLAEIGFVSNSKEEALLKKPDYRQKLAEALYKGIEKYAESLSHFQVAGRAVKVLAFRHVPFEGTGRIASPAGAARHRLRYADLYREGSATARYRGLRRPDLHGRPDVGQRPAAVPRPRAGSHRAGRRAGTAAAGHLSGIAADRAVLGADVHRNPEKEIGWFDLALHRSRRQDRPFWGNRGPRTGLPLAQRHLGSAAGSRPAGWSNACGNQAFRAGRNVYGLQFHLEVTPEMIADWWSRTRIAATSGNSIPPSTHTSTPAAWSSCPI